MTYLVHGAVGREFVDLLTSEVSMLSNREVRSERLIVFLSVILQRDSMVKRVPIYDDYLGDEWKLGDLKDLMNCYLKWRDVLPSSPSLDSRMIMLITQLRFSRG